MKKVSTVIISLIMVVSFLVPLLSVEGGARPAKTPYIPVLMYHAFIEGRNDNISVDPQRFREQIKALQAAGFEGITVTDYYQFLQGKKELPDKPIMITLDDGYLDNYTHAYPILQELEMKATIFVIVRSRDEKLGFADHFDWDQAREMISSGLIDIQSHSYDSHRYERSLNGEQPLYLARLLKADGTFETEEEYAERVYQDLKRAKEKIERELAIQVVSIAYPYGAYNQQVEAMAKDLGHMLTFSVREGLFVIGDYPYGIPRINVDGRFSGDDLVRRILKHEDNLPTEGKVHIKWNDQYLLSDPEPLLQNRTVYIPLRYLQSMDDVQVDWQDEQILLHYQSKSVIIDPVKKTARRADQSEGERIDLLLVNQRSYLPIRVLANLLQLDIHFEDRYLGPHKLVQIRD
jgi:peptidoglycan/xylan/chitin deacetylase (PgdA/CDA1 family)